MPRSSHSNLLIVRVRRTISNSDAGHDTNQAEQSNPLASYEWPLLVSKFTWIDGLCLMSRGRLE